MYGSDHPSRRDSQSCSSALLDLTGTITCTHFLRIAFRSRFCREEWSNMTYTDWEAGGRVTPLGTILRGVTDITMQSYPALEQCACNWRPCTDLCTWSGSGLGIYSNDVGTYFPGTYVSVTRECLRMLITLRVSLAGPPELYWERGYCEILALDIRGWVHRSSTACRARAATALFQVLATSGCKSENRAIQSNCRRIWNLLSDWLTRLTLLQPDVART